MSDFIGELGQAVDLVERVGQLSPFAFTLLITALEGLLCILLVRVVLKLYVRLGDAKAMLVAHYVQGGMKIDEAKRFVNKELEEEDD